MKRTGYDSEIFQKVKGSVTIRQAAEYCGLQVNRKGLCLCPFHQDRSPSMRIYPNGKGFYCFACGAGGDQIGLVARLKGLSNYEAAKELAEAFCVPLQEPMAYRERREAEKVWRRRRELEAFRRHAGLWVRMYWILLCEARRDPESPHFLEGIHGLEYAEHLLRCLEECPEEVYADKKAVKRIEEIEGRIAGWYCCPSADRTVPG